MVHTLGVVEGRGACYERREGLQTSPNICVAVSRVPDIRIRGRARRRMEKGSNEKGAKAAWENRTAGMNSQVYVYNLNYKFDRVTEA